MGMYARLLKVESDLAEHIKNHPGTKNHPGSVTVPVVAKVDNEVAGALKRAEETVNELALRVEAQERLIEALSSTVNYQTQELHRLDSEKANRAGRKKSTP